MAEVKTDFLIGKKPVYTTCQAAIMHTWAVHKIVVEAVVLNPLDGRSITEVWVSVGDPPHSQAFQVERSEDVPSGTVRVRLP